MIDKLFGVIGPLSVLGLVLVLIGLCGVIPIAVVVVIVKYVW